MPKGIYKRIKAPWNKDTKGLVKSNSGSFKKGHNTWNKDKKGLQVCWNKGGHLSDETRKKISLNHADMNGSKNPMFGRKLTEKQRKEMSEREKGVKHWMFGKHHSIETRLKMKNSALKGKDSPLWKGGVTPTNRMVRFSFEYKLWREAVFERDNYTCVWCGVKSVKGHSVVLNADHIKPFALYPELRFAIDNGRTLCIDCHKATETYGKKI